MPEYKPVHFHFFDPTGPRLFKGKANDRAEFQYVTCCLGECPLRDAKTCATRAGLFGASCPYGRVGRSTGPTARAKSFSKFEKDAKAEFSGVPYLDRPTEKMAFVGEYVYLPYSHMNMNKSVWGEKSSGLLSSGSDFLPKSQWTMETVVSIINFRPQALFGGEIRAYQKESVPKFLTHLRECDPEMWSALVAKNPHLDSQSNHVGRKAFLKTLKAPIKWLRPYNGQYPVLWSWDGEYLTTTSEHAYNSTWGHVKAVVADIRLKPDETTTVEVQSNDWVLETTRFLD